MWSLPSGTKFLAGISTRQLRSLYAAEQHPKSKLRLLAAMHRRQGKSIDDIAYMLSKPRRTVHGWLTRFAERGIDAKDARPQTGRPSQLTLAQKRRLIKDLERGPPNNATGVWSTKEVRELLHRKYNAVFVKQHVWRMLDQLGFSLLRPRKKHYRSADAATIAAFKKKRIGWCTSTSDDILSSQRKMKQPLGSSRMSRVVGRDEEATLLS
jgi:transposase